MARYRVGPGCVTATQACEWVGLDYDTYIKLVAEGWLERTPKSGIDTDYFVALFLFAQLAKRLGFEVVRHVWRQVRDELPIGEPIGDYLKVYVGIPMPAARLLRSADELDRAMANEEAARAIDVIPLLKAARRFFEDGGTAKAPGRKVEQNLMRVLEA